MEIYAAMSSTNHRDYSELANFDFLRKLFTLSQSSPNLLSQYIPYIELIYILVTSSNGLCYELWKSILMKPLKYLWYVIPVLSCKC